MSCVLLVRVRVAERLKASQAFDKMYEFLAPKKFMFNIRHSFNNSCTGTRRASPPFSDADAT